ncbi:tetratricopeptide repeat protein [Polynucleobacter sp. MWH-Spelu-300-X4]|uniref:tetratricopeptide repeat protein n=1 Tax=Polynucleobacter sp. MWH-Spelu-300-X4 TaxID=2689109 RepID=UPI001BFDD82B|nr:tetratricopeptide repeat protein [Polynucleobacter sp. MWH-Spelu-300-X4]QWD79134.1 tetratricopeptide repeat protein [Polynucleobacter sp. MWH-Spelu-300-X4]
MLQPTYRPNPLKKRLMLSLWASSLIGALVLTATLPAKNAEAQALQLPGSTTTSTGSNISRPTKSGLAAQSDPSPFENNGNAVQSAQMQPSLASPFIVLQKVPEPKNKNAIPQDIYKLIGDKKYPEAITAIDKELASNPRNVQLRFIRSRIQIEMGEIEAAKKTLLELTQQFPELPEPYNNLAVLHAQSGNLDQAKEYLELALKVQPAFPAALENLGDVYTRLAARAYGKAYSLNKRLISSERKMKLATQILN